MRVIVHERMGRNGVRIHRGRLGARHRGRQSLLVRQPRRLAGGEEALRWREQRSRQMSACRWQQQARSRLFCCSPTTNESLRLCAAMNGSAASLRMCFQRRVRQERALAGACIRYDFSVRAFAGRVLAAATGEAQKRMADTKGKERRGERRRSAVPHYQHKLQRRGLTGALSDLPRTLHLLASELAIR